MIDGIKVTRDQNIETLDEDYFQAIQSITKEALSELKFVQFISYKHSKSTDSMYFKFEMNHHRCIFTLSLRTHPPT